LRILGPYLPLAEVVLIAAHPGLRTLSFLPSDSKRRYAPGRVQFDRVEFERLVADWKPQGVRFEQLSYDAVARNDVIVDWVKKLE